MLKPIYEIVKAYDSADLLTKIAALQIFPENADHAIRLEALAHTAVSIPLISDKPKISRHRLNKLCNEPPLGDSKIQSQEDPCPNAFTEAFTFFGGSYIVFPGMSGETTFHLKHLNKAVFFSNDFKDHKDFIKRVFELNRLILAISNAIAHRAGLCRNLSPKTTSRQIIIPSNFEKLKLAVRFTSEELDELLNFYDLRKSAITPFIVEFGEIALESYTYQNSPLHAKPIVRTERGIIVSEPGLLLDSLRHHIILIAKKFGLLKELSLKYHHEVLGTVGKSPYLLNMEQIPVKLPEKENDLLLHEGIWRLDTDKVVYVEVNTDNFEDYVGKQVFEDQNSQTIAELIDKRLTLVEEAIFDQVSNLNEIFFVIVQSGIGRTNVFRLTLSGLKTDPPFLMLSASELEVLGLLYGYDKLTLYKFAKVFDNLKKNVKVMAWSTLDVFETYRSHDFSFYLSDERRPDFLAIQAGDERYLRVEVLEKLDIHAVPYISRGVLT